LMTIGNVSFKDVAGKLSREGEPPATSAAA
jgi:hypothetical protein